MKQEPVRGRGWWWFKIVVLGLTLAGFATGMMWSVFISSYEERTGLSIDLGTGYELGLRSLPVGAAVAVMTVLVAWLIDRRRRQI